MTHVMQVYIVDDDQTVLIALSQLLSAEGYKVEAYNSAEDFLAKVPADASGCVITDLRLRGQSGVSLIETLKARGSTLYAILLTAYGNIPIAVQATKLGAVDVIEKPVQANLLLEAVRKAMAESERAEAAATLVEQSDDRLAQLSARELAVLERVVAGLQSKNIAKELGISYRTVEIHRSNILRKMGASNVVELISIYLKLRKTPDKS
jgi:FixJ family two-component response regulator